MMNDSMPAGFPIGCGDTGSGRPLVLLHCSGADRHVWARVMDAWTAMDDMPPRRILRPEMFGCGTTAAWPAEGNFTLDHVVDLMARVTGHLEEPFDLVGHSFGGAVALQVARSMPGRLRSLAVIEPTYFSLLKDTGPLESQLFDQIVSVAQAILRGADSQREDERLHGMGVFVDYWNGAGKWQSIPPEMKQAMSASIRGVAQDFMALFSEPTRLHDLAGLRIPTLIVNGMQSPEPAQRIAALLETTLPQAERCTLPDAGHMIPLSHAKQLAGLLATWHRRRDAAPAPALDARRRAIAGA